MFVDGRKGSIRHNVLRIRDVALIRMLKSRHKAQYAISFIRCYVLGGLSALILILNEMKFYKSTAGCGYQQYAYVTPIAKNKNGNDYLCIWTNQNSYPPIYVEGEIVEDLEDIYLEEIELNIDDFEISKSFLFKFFTENFSFENGQ